MRQTLLKKLTTSGALLLAAGAMSSYAAAPSGPQGFATAKEFLDIGGTAIQPLRDDPRFPNNPSGTYYTPRLEWPTGPNDATPPPGNVKDNYGVLIQGYIYPPADGDYIFAMSADDNAEFWLSSDDKPANIVQIAAEPQWNDPRQYSVTDRRNPDAPENVSSKIKLTKGKAYYFEALMKEGGGGDNLSVAWTGPGATTPPQNGDIPILGKYLATVDKTLATPEVLATGNSLFGVTFTVVEGGGTAATLDAASVKVTIDGNAATATTTKDGLINTIATTSATPFASDSKHTAVLSAKDSKGTAINASFSFTVEHYGTITADLKVKADTSKPGFVMSMFENSANQNNTIQRILDALAGKLKDADGNLLPNNADPSATGVASGPGKTVNGLVVFEIPTVINMSQTGGDNAGNWTTDDVMPGIPSTDGSTDGIAASFDTYVDLPQGFITMGVNSDDGFRTTAGLVNDAVAAINLGQFDGGRGASDTIFQIYVQEAGTYPLRTIWEEGGGGANIEWFTVNNGKKVLLNDAANGGYKAYRALSGGAGSPIAVTSVSPGPGATEVSTAPTITAAIADGATKVDKASVKLNVAGKDVAAKVDQAGGITTVSYTASPDFDTATLVNVSLTFKDTAGASRTATWSFTTTVLGKDALYIEAEDFNFGGGQWLKTDNIGMDKKPYPGGSYKDLGTDADAEIDWHNPGGNAGQAYRSGTGVAAGKENGSAGSFRGYFDVTSWWTVGWNDAGDWQNYTRKFPTPAQKYNVYGHVSSGGSPINFELAQITSDPTKPDQTKKVLAEIKPGRATAGWDTLEIFPFTEVGTQTPAVVELGGEVTLRITLPGGNGDIDYIVFSPAKAPSNNTPPALSIANSNGKVVITYEGTLQGSDTINGTFTDVAGASSPFTADTSKGQKFYKARR